MTNTTLTIQTPVGPLTLTGDDEALVELRLPNTQNPATTASGKSAAVLEAARQLAEYFAGTRQTFDVILKTQGTDFQREVWRALSEIPYGETISYAQLAQMVGRPNAYRAVGQANGANPLAIIVPCHRVIASDAGLGGYAGGLELKRKLLALEGAAR